MKVTADKNKFILHTKNSSYALALDNDGRIIQLHWGGKITNPQDFEMPQSRNLSGFYDPADVYMEDFTSFGCKRYTETGMKVRFFDNVGDFRPTAKAAVDEDTLVITLTDSHYPLRVRVYYKVYYDENIIMRWQEAENFGKDDIILEKFCSAQIHLRGDDYEMVNFNGHWISEFQKHSQPLKAGKQVHESIRGITAHTANPVFALHKGASEDCGEVYFGALAYSGNFKLVGETTPYDTVNMVIGISDTDFSWVLKPGESLTSPAVYLGYCSNGFSELSNTLHHFQLKHIAPKKFADKALPALYNSWEATYFDVTEKGQIALADRAAKLGIELFAMDDGWFGQRKDDHAGLGDWYVNKEKFPNGLKPLIDHVKNLGMKFGIWIEPEMVNADSDLFRTHPEWTYQYNTREILEGRFQYQLDLTIPEVVEYIIDMIDNLLSSNDISFIKWDCNKSIVETSPKSDKTPEENKEIWLRNTNSVYEIIKIIRAKHPSVEFEACASGGGRVDMGAMQFFDEFWPSDNTDALDRLDIQGGYSLFYPAKYMRAWITDNPTSPDRRSIPMDFRVNVSLMGVLGISNNLLKVSDDDFNKLTTAVQTYKRIRNTVHFGQIYRLKNYRRDTVHAVQFVKDEKSVLFAFLPFGHYGEQVFNIKLKGLDAEARYKINMNGIDCLKSGAYCMNHGLDIILKGDYATQMIEIEVETKTETKTEI